MKQWIDSAPYLRTMFFFFSILYASTVMSAAQTQSSGHRLAEIPDTARVWKKHSVEEGAEYSDFDGGDVAFIDNGKGAWYYLTEGTSGQDEWRLFHEGATLDLANSDSSITETLQYEVISGSAFFENGPPGTYQMLLDGRTGNLITSSGVSFNPSDFDLLRGINGLSAYYNVKSGVWWSSNPNDFGVALSQIPLAPYTPLSVTFGSVPDRRDLDGIKSQLTFDIDKRLYHMQGSSHVVKGFHHSVAGNYRQWENESDMPCSAYGGYPGNTVAYVNDVWYSTRDDGSYNSIITGRYLAFVEQYPDTAFLAHAFTAGKPIDNDGPLERLNLRLDGQTGELVDSSGQAIDPERYVSPEETKTSCGIKYTLLLNEPLMIKGLAGPAPFKAGSTEITLMRVVPLRNVKNNPFNDLSLPLAINQARAIGVVAPPVVVSPPVVVVPPIDEPPVIDPPIVILPPVGNCPVNSNLSLIAAIPSQSPLGNVIGISTGTPALLNAGFAVAPSEEAIKFTVTPVNAISANTSIGGGFTLVSGNVGNVMEGASTDFRIRRNIDGAEFEVTFTINVDIVFDDNGVIITNLSARQCTAGGPV